MLTYFLVALGLSMDSMAVSISSGICIPDLRFRDALRSSLTFGFFQFLMPLIGWLLGDALSSRLDRYSHWIAFGLLALVGGKMIIESLREADPAVCEDDEGPKGILQLWTLLVLAVATSLDALAVGMSYSILRVPIFLPATIIGAVTFLLCLVGTEFGKRLGPAFKRWAEIAGGMILIAIGANLLLRNLL